MPLGKRADFGDARYAGAETVFTCDIVAALQVRVLKSAHPSDMKTGTSVK